MDRRNGGEGEGHVRRAGLFVDLEQAVVEVVHGWDEGIEQREADCCIAALQARHPLATASELIRSCSSLRRCDCARLPNPGSGSD
jgi:hypothetical protein